MLVSTKGRYALRIFMELASRPQGAYVSLDDIAEAQNVSEKYLESIVRGLVKSKMLEGQRGRGGGYRLTRVPEAYSVGEILEHTEGSLAPVSCLDCSPNPCERAADCRTLPMWKRLDSIIYDYLNSVTLADLMVGSDGVTRPECCGK